MQYLKKTEEQEATQWMKEAAKIATKALCLRAKCGTVIVKDGTIIGRGYNAPPLDNKEHRMCLDAYDFSGKPKYDHTCCMHAEWRAILDATKNNPEKLLGSRLYFTRVDNEGSIKKSGEPYCTVCSRFALDIGIGEFVLWHEDGICSYPTDEYNRLSYAYKDPEISKNLEKK
ncbi:MAG TPA: deaminase [Candidatus Paceibacterota bacterium]|nr:deaminase [Candidatus Paceibacterota bacterium]